MAMNHDKIQSALKAIDVNQENLKKYFYEMILDSLYLMHQTMKERSNFGLTNQMPYSIDDVSNLFLVFLSENSKNSKNETLKQTT